MFLYGTCFGILVFISSLFIKNVPLKKFENSFSNNNEKNLEEIEIAVYKENETQIK